VRKRSPEGLITGNADALVFFLFDLLYINGGAISSAPLLDRKERLRGLFSDAGSPLYTAMTRSGAARKGLLVAYYTPDGILVYAGRAGVGISNAELERLWRPPATARHRRDAARCASASDQPLRLTARPQSCALGSTRACSRGQISNLDGR
jgi:ATP-dependent DNA ligase